MIEFGQGDADGNGFLAVHIGGTDFSLCGRADDDVEDFAESVHGTIEGRHTNGRHVGVTWGVAEEKMTSSPAAGAGLREIGSVAVEVQYHAAGAVPDDGPWVGGNVIQDPAALLLR